VEEAGGWGGRDNCVSARRERADEKPEGIAGAEEGAERRRLPVLVPVREAEVEVEVDAGAASRGRCEGGCTSTSESESESEDEDDEDDDDDDAEPEEMSMVSMVSTAASSQRFCSLAGRGVARAVI
jgi:hypothetical protein